MQLHFCYFKINQGTQCIYIYVYNIIKANFEKKEKKKKIKKRKGLQVFLYSLKYLNKNREKKRIS